MNINTKTIEPGILIFLVWRDKILLILRDNNNDTISANEWSPVSGKVETENSYYETLQDELLEEICIIPQNIHYLGTTRRHNAIFYGRISDIEKNSVSLGNEGQDLKFVTHEEMLQLKLAEAISAHIGNAPEVFKRMITDGYIPTAEDLFLRECKAYPPST